jgi:hypothetical protein
MADLATEILDFFYGSRPDATSTRPTSLALGSEVIDWARLDGGLSAFAFALRLLASLGPTRQSNRR